VNEALAFLVAHREVSGPTHSVFQEAVRSHFDATFASRPSFGRAYETAARPLAAEVRVDVPPFDVADRFGLAPVRERSDRRFEEADQMA
jgi:hypothetical protein